MNEPSSRRVRTILVSAVICVFALSLVMTISAGQRDYIRVANSYPDVKLATLAASAEAIAVVRFTGESRVAWNSADNSRWEPSVGTGVGAWIYRDDAFEVIRTIRGSLPSDKITVRGVGGTVGNVTMDFEGQLDWRTGSSYLVFLQQEQTPIREGWERMWTVAWLGHGSFEAVGARWSNASQTLTLSEAEILGERP